MSIQGNAGAGRAAREIREYAESLERNVTDPEATWVIAQIIAKAEEIELQCDTGWY